MSDLSASLTFRKGPSRVSLERVALLEAVDELGSITAAAKRLGLSYRAAWDSLQALNNLFDAPVMEATAGGKAGGVARLTPRGRAVVRAFHRVQAELDATLSRLDGLLSEENLSWTLGMRTSARNALRGKITSVSCKDVTAQVGLLIAPGVELAATLTRQSLEDLGLEAGGDAIALIKAGFVTLIQDPAAAPDCPNRIAGQVLSREDGANLSEVVLEIAAGKTLVISLSLAEAEALNLQPGLSVWALIEAAQIILAVE